MKILSDSTLKGLNKNALIKTIKDLQKKIGNIYSLLNDYECQGNEVIDAYCEEIRNELDR